MDDAMVTGRMPAKKKAAGNRVLEKVGLNASQAINMLYDRLIEDQDARVLGTGKATLAEWRAAAKFVDAIASPVPVRTRFDDMSKGEIALERYKARSERQGISHE